MSLLLKSYETGIRPIFPILPNAFWCPWNPTEEQIIDSIYFAARGCYYSKQPPTGKRYQTLYKEEKDLLKKLRLIEHLINKKHRTVLTHVNFSFWVEGIPQKIMVQLVRHGVGTTYDVQSSRFNQYDFTNKREDEFGVIPGRHRFISTGTAILLDHYKKTMEVYENLIENHGFTPEEASYVLCLGHFVSAQMTYNLVSLQHLYQTRILGKTGKPQEEAKEAVQAIIDCFTQYCPKLSSFLFHEKNK